MKILLTPLIRRIIPRPVRNALRRPTNTLRRCNRKLEYALGSVATVEPVADWKAKCHPICKEQFQVFANDDAQRAEMSEFRSSCHADMRLLDVGAHWGMFALAAAHFSGNTARTVCVEPSPAVVKILKANLSLNGLNESVKIVTAAAGVEDSTLRMLTTGAGGADYFVVPHEKRRDTVTVQQVSLTNLCYHLNFQPTHLKVDVEGFEEEALSGALELLNACHPELFLELHGDLVRKRGRNPLAVLKLLSASGYSAWKREGQIVTEEDLAKSGFNARLYCHLDERHR